MDKFPRAPVVQSELAPIISSEAPELRVEIPEEIESKLFAPEDKEADFFISQKFLTTINFLLRQAGDSIISQPWRLFTDLRFKRPAAEEPETESKETANQETPSAKVDAVTEIDESAPHAGDTIWLSLDGLLADPEDTKYLQTWLDFIGFENARTEDGGLVLEYPEEFPKRGIRLRNVDYQELHLNAKKRLKKLDERGDVMKRAETPNVLLASAAPIEALLMQAGYMFESQAQKYHRSWVLPPGRYMVPNRKKSIVLKTPTKIEINWPPAGMAPWLEVEAGKDGDVRRGAVLLGFFKTDLRPISTAEHYRAEAIRRGLTNEAFAAQVKAFSPADQLTINQRMIELQKFEQKLSSQ